MQTKDKRGVLWQTRFIFIIILELKTTGFCYICYAYFPHATIFVQGFCILPLMQCLKMPQDANQMLL